jgi:dynein heavy chain
MEGLCYAFSEDDKVKAKNNDTPTFQDFWDYSKKNLLNEKLIKRVKGFKLR